MCQTDNSAHDQIEYTEEGNMILENVGIVSPSMDFIPFDEETAHTYTRYFFRICSVEITVMACSETLSHSL